MLMFEVFNDGIFVFIVAFSNQYDGKRCDYFLDLFSIYTSKLMHSYSRFFGLVLEVGITALKQICSSDSGDYIVFVLQMGTIVETKADFYSSRIPKKSRKTSLVDELLADAEFRR